MVVCVRGRQVHAEWGWLAAGGGAELGWWLYATSWSPSPPLCLHNGHLGTHQQKPHKTTETHTHAYSAPKYCIHKTHTHTHTLERNYKMKATHA